MLTIVLSSRRKGNLSSNLEALLNSVIANTNDEEKRQLEFIVKFDSDDEVPQFISSGSFPFILKWLQYSRGEGRYDLYNFINYMVTLRDDRSRFVMTMADDFTARRPGFVSEILAHKSTYRIIGGAYNNIVGDNIVIPLGANHRNRNEWEWSIGAYCPIIGVNILKCVMNFGISPSTDAWAVALALAVYKLYGIRIWEPLASFYTRNEVYDLPQHVYTQPEHHQNLIPYNTLDMMNHRNNHRERFWEIIESQAKNVYLNMKYDGEIQ